MSCRGKLGLYSNEMSSSNTTNAPVHQASHVKTTISFRYSYTTTLTLISPMESISKNGKSRTNDSSGGAQNECLLPGLPDHLAQLCLTLLPPSTLFPVCRSWRRLLYSSSFPPFFSLYALLSPSVSSSPTRKHGDEDDDDQVDRINSIELFALDPISSAWQSLPSPPKEPPLHLLHHHPSFLSRKLPIQSLTVSNYFLLMAGTTDNLVPALYRPLVFSPGANHWFVGPPFTIPRRWCATRSVHGAVYLASGMGSHYRGDVARSMEQWDLKENNEDWRWEKMATLKDGRFSREAVEAVGYKGKLCMVNVKGNAAKEGLVYDVEADKWEAMPKGMLAGWNGPVATMNKDAMYAVDEVKGALREYDGERDAWKEVIELPELKRAEQIAAGRGRVCAVCGGGERIVVVDVVARPARVWMVQPPHGQQVVALHILPRISRHI